ncbi:MAG: hypothetical protein J6A72_04770 [Alistipes sp.]|nr:hypothetical protein [Alistipes sp.]MBO5331678.1 hypothetical protein [Alistipes sp.]
MENNKLSEAQSLELITSMIQDSRSRLARNSGTPFLIWGYTTVAVSLFNALALYLGWSHAWAWSWFTIPVIGWLGMMLLFKQEPSARNYIDRIVSMIWVVIGLSFAWLFVGAVVFGCSISFLTVVVMGIGTVLTGCVIKHRTTAICGWAAMCASLIFPIVYFIMAKSGSASAISEFWIWGELIVFALIFLVMMVIPGHILNHKYNK